MRFVIEIPDQLLPAAAPAVGAAGSAPVGAALDGGAAPDLAAASGALTAGEAVHGGVVAAAQAAIDGGPAPS